MEDRNTAARWGAPAQRAWHAAAVIGFGLLVLCLALGAGNGTAGTSVYYALEVLAAAGCLLRAAAVRQERLAWTILGLGIVSYTVADLSFDYVYGGSPPAVSICDAFYLAFYPACYAALALLVRSRISCFERGVWLDGAIAALATAAVSAAIVLQVVLEHTSGGRLAVVVNLAYPVADAVLLAMVILVVALTRRRPARAWLVAGAAFGLIAFADAVYLYLNATGGYREGTLLDALWPAGLLLLGAAAWQPVQHEHAVELEGRFLSATPLVCGVVALGVLIVSSFHDLNPVADALAAGAILAVFVRTAVSFTDNGRLLAAARAQSLTDPLTGLGNRRSLTLALERTLRRSDRHAVLAIFDLNGFKTYNDTFGHPSGDALLVRFAARLAAAATPAGAAFRMGGDEFCVLVSAGPEEAAAVVAAGVAALTEEGEGFHVGCEHGAVVLPDEAGDPSAALRLADERLYAQKYRLYRRELVTGGDDDLREHAVDVAELSVAVGERLGLDTHDLEQLRLAAELHDIGKVAIPDAVLKKPGALSEREWEFVRQHTVIGQRILAASPGMREVGGIVRATHERWDGNGYGDGLEARMIPLAARIIAVCDAYSAMTTDRPYRQAMLPQDALAELRRCAGTQFDPEVVFTFCRLHDSVVSPASADVEIRAAG
jgi:diguanylate cyclase (GGDEF)-like protein